MAVCVHVNAFSLYVFPQYLTGPGNTRSGEKETIKTAQFASKVSAAPAAAVSSDDSEEDEDLHTHTPVAHKPEKGQGKVASSKKVEDAAGGDVKVVGVAGRTAKLEAVKARDDDRPVAKMVDGELEEFYVSCDAKNLPGVDSKRHLLGPFDMEVEYYEFSKALEKEFGQKVVWKYQTFEKGNLGPLATVENADAFDDMLDYLEKDAEGDSAVHSGTLDIEVRAVPAKSAVKEPEAKAAQKPATKAKKEELEEIKLHFTKQKITVVIDFDATWDEAVAAIAKSIGRKVYFSWLDDDETVVVDTLEEFEDLCAELEVSILCWHVCYLFSILFWHVCCASFDFCV